MDPVADARADLPLWQPPHALERRRLLAASVGCTLGFFCLLPWAKQAMPAAPAFMPAQQAALGALGLALALLWFGQYRLLRAPGLLWLAGGQAVAALLALVHLACMPGLFSPEGDATAAAWLSLLWHAAWPLGVMGHAWTKARRRPADEPSDRGIGLTVIVVVLALLAACASADEVLQPAWLRDGRPTAALILAVSAVSMLSLLTVLALWLREPRLRLDLWLCLAMCAWAAGTALSGLFSAGRYDLGFYAGGVFALAGQAVLLGLLLRQLLAHAADRLQVRALAREHAAEIERLEGALTAAHAELAQQAYRLDDSLRAKSTFLSGMSHELRTPLNAIIGFSEMMKDGQAGELTAAQRGYAGHIFHAGQHLLSLINDVLELSRIEAGDAELLLEPADVGVLLADAVAQAQERAGAKQIRLKCDVPEYLGTMQVDPRRLRQMVGKLLCNALRFTPAGGGVTVRAGLVSRSAAAEGLPGFDQGLRLPLPDNEFQQFLQVSVSDTGVGLRQGEAERLFLPFPQLTGLPSLDDPAAPAPARVATGGTGIGLAMVRRLAEQHGGSVAVSSEPGRGSCFTLWLPWRAEPAQPVGGTPWQAAHHEGPLALVVEDDDAAATLLRLQLEAEGFRVHHVASAEAALQLSPECRPDVITVDIQLPGMDGWDLLALLHDVPEWEGVPVVVVSVSADHARGFSVGASAVLQKPVSRDALARSLARLSLIPGGSRDVTVLVIDDDTHAVEILASHLHQAGYVVLCAFGGAEGIELAQRYRPDVIALDLEMPEVHGFEVVQALKADASTAHIPIVVVTARQLSHEDRQALNGHIHQVLDKNEFSEGGFIGEVRRALRRGDTLPA